MLGLEPGDEFALSALGEIGNIVGASYINALGSMTGMELEPTPPATATDMLGAIVVASALASAALTGDVALLLDSTSRSRRGLLDLLPPRARPGRRRRAPLAARAELMGAAETMVRMGELAVSSASGRVLVSLGLGSCIGLALIDRRMGIAGLAHIVLPQSQGHARRTRASSRTWPFRRCCPSSRRWARARCAWRPCSWGAPACSPVSSASLEVGQRNEAAVRDLLKQHRIPSWPPPPAATRAAPSASTSESRR